MAISLVIVDDHPVFRHGLRSLLERAGYRIVGEASDGAGALKLTQETRPDVILLDLSMPGLNGLDAAKEIMKQLPRAKIVLLTVHREEQFVEEALRAGIRGYVLKSEATITLTEAVQEVYRGNTFVSPSISAFVMRAVASESGKSTVANDLLSRRELQVLQLIAEGNTTKEVAEKLNLTFKTVEYYRTSLMNKLEIHSTADLVRYAVRRGLVKP